MRLINADELLKDKHQYYDYLSGEYYVHVLVKDIESAATIEPEQKKGYWIGRPIAGYSTVRCSVCTELFLENQGRWNFCPNCGAKMEVDQCREEE